MCHKADYVAWGNFVIIQAAVHFTADKIIGSFIEKICLHCLLMANNIIGPYIEGYETKINSY